MGSLHAESGFLWAASANTCDKRSFAEPKAGCASLAAEPRAGCASLAPCLRAWTAGGGCFTGPRAVGSFLSGECTGNGKFAASASRPPTVSGILRFANGSSFVEPGFCQSWCTGTEPATGIFGFVGGSKCTKPGLGSSGPASAKPASGIFVCWSGRTGTEPVSSLCWSGRTCTTAI
jgi:hypothetical protein